LELGSSELRHDSWDLSLRESISQLQHIQTRAFSDQLTRQMMIFPFPKFSFWPSRTPVTAEISQFFPSVLWMPFCNALYALYMPFGVIGYFTSRDENGRKQYLFGNQFFVIFL
jgi:hypothetical protein